MRRSIAELRRIQTDRAIQREVTTTPDGEDEVGLVRRMVGQHAMKPGKQLDACGPRIKISFQVVKIRCPCRIDVIGEPPESLGEFLPRSDLIRFTHDLFNRLRIDAPEFDLHGDIFGGVTDEERLLDAAAVHGLDRCLHGRILSDIFGDSPNALELRVEQVQMDVNHPRRLERLAVRFCCVLRRIVAASQFGFSKHMGRQRCRTDGSQKFTPADTASVRRLSRTEIQHHGISLTRFTQACPPDSPMRGISKYDLTGVPILVVLVAVSLDRWLKGSLSECRARGDG